MRRVFNIKLLKIVNCFNSTQEFPRARCFFDEKLCINENQSSVHLLRCKNALPAEFWTRLYVIYWNRLRLSAEFSISRFTKRNLFCIQRATFAEMKSFDSVKIQILVQCWFWTKLCHAYNRVSVVTSDFSNKIKFTSSITLPENQQVRLINLPQLNWVFNVQSKSIDRRDSCTAHSNFLLK